LNSLGPYKIFKLSNFTHFTGPHTLVSQDRELVKIRSLTTWRDKGTLRALLLLLLLWLAMALGLSKGKLRPSQEATRVCIQTKKGWAKFFTFRPTLKAVVEDQNL